MDSVDGLYIHVPFCKKRCDYCDFYSSTDVLPTKDFVASTLKDIERYKPLLANLKTVYFGGGTPSLLGEKLLDLLDAIDLSKTQEVTVECNPESFSKDLLESYVSHGVTRISLGVQTLLPSELEALGRIATREESLHALDVLAQSNVTFSADVMVGIPLQTKQSLTKTLEDLCAFRSHHLSVYPLSVPNASVLQARIQNGTVHLPVEDEQVELMLLANSFLEEAGYEHYEVANYARKGFVAKHNLAYWKQRSYLGLGKSASSMLFASKYRTFQACNASAPPLKQDTHLVRFLYEELRELDELNGAQVASENLMLAARLATGLSNAVLAKARKVLNPQKLDSTLAKAVEDNLLRKVPDGYHVTQQGWLFGNELYSRFMELGFCETT